MRYTPDEGDAVRDSLKYSITDARGQTAEAKVTITIERPDESSEPEPTKSAPVSVPTAPSVKESIPAQ
ncbi:Ig-like domain-containing protein [Brevibacterium sp. UCMA 11752]|uniref:Ig-like domain-containing protein n=1 Tax=Brevibacterium sp. UCMA 11752 TaxID=2745946 RepID=UPI003FA41D51